MASWWTFVFLFKNVLLNTLCFSFGVDKIPSLNNLLLKNLQKFYEYNFKIYMSDNVLICILDF